MYGYIYSGLIFVTWWGGGGGGETGVQPMQSALICYLFEPICK